MKKVILNVTNAGFTARGLQALFAKKATETNAAPATPEQLLKLKSFATSDTKMVIDLVTTGEEALLARELLDTPRKATKTLAANVNADGAKAFAYDKASKTKVPVEGVEATHYCATASFASKMAIDPAIKKAANAKAGLGKKAIARKAAAKKAKAKKARKAKFVSIGTKVMQAAAVAAVTVLTSVIARKGA